MSRSTGQPFNPGIFALKRSIYSTPVGSFHLGDGSAVGVGEAGSGEASLSSAAVDFFFFQGLSVVAVPPRLFESLAAPVGELRATGRITFSPCPSSSCSMSLRFESKLPGLPVHCEVVPPGHLVKEGLEVTVQGVAKRSAKIILRLESVVEHSSHPRPSTRIASGCRPVLSRQWCHHNSTVPACQERSGVGLGGHLG